VRHGYTNLTTQVGDTVLKRYQGPAAAARAGAERTALLALRDHLPVPAVLAATPRSLTTRLSPGEHGQDLIDAGLAEPVLAGCGRLLRELQALDPALVGGPVYSGVIRHGDFGPNNVLFRQPDLTVSALLDWEFSGVGPPIADLAWCEWIVRMHHPDARDALRALFDGYGRQPPFEQRQAEMLRRCRELADFARRWDPTGAGVATWTERIAVTGGWTA